MSKKIWIIIASIIGIAAVAAIVLIVVFSTKGTPNDKPVEDEQFRSILVEKVNGDVFVNRKDKDLKAYENMNLRSGDTISTNATSNTILKLDGDKFIYIGENSNINLYSSEKDSSKTIIRVNEGSIVTEVKNKLSDLEEFGVETPNSSMAIRGTIFSVKVIKEANQIKIGYKLFEGKIELSVIEKTETGINVGKFSVKPMEEINILSKDQGILEAQNLTDVLDKINNNDQTVITKSYETVEEYISETDKIELVEKELAKTDIEDILRNLPSNADSNSIRLVTVNAIFRLVVNGNVTNDSFMKYDSNESFECVLEALDNNRPVIGWLINGEEVDGENYYRYTVTKTSLIEPIYGEQFSDSGVTIRPTTYTNINVISYGETEEEATVLANGSDKNFSDASSVSLSYDSFDDPNGNIAFLGWYEIGSNDNYIFISREQEITYPVSHACVISPIFVAIQNMPTLTLDGVEGPITNDTLFSIDMNKKQSFKFTIDGMEYPLNASDLGLSYNNKFQPTYESYIEFDEDGRAKFLYQGDYNISWSFYSVSGNQNPIYTESITFSARDVYFTMTFTESLVDTYEGLSSLEGYYYSEMTYIGFLDENNNNISPTYFNNDVNSYENYDEYKITETTGDLNSISFDLTYDSTRFSAYVVDLNLDISNDTDGKDLIIYSSSSPEQGDYKYILLVDNTLTTENLTGKNVDEILMEYSDGSASSSMVKLIAFDSIPS